MPCGSVTHLVSPCGGAQITVTVGAAEAMYNCMQAFVEKGDEVLIFEPFFDTCAWAWWTSVVVDSRTVLTLLTIFAVPQTLRLCRWLVECRSSCHCVPQQRLRTGR